MLKPLAKRGQCDVYIWVSLFESLSKIIIIDVGRRTVKNVIANNLNIYLTNKYFHFCCQIPASSFGPNVLLDENALDNINYLDNNIFKTKEKIFIAFQVDHIFKNACSWSLFGSDKKVYLGPGKHQGRYIVYKIWDKPTSLLTMTSPWHSVLLLFIWF